MWYYVPVCFHSFVLFQLPNIKSTVLQNEARFRLWFSSSGRVYEKLITKFLKITRLSSNPSGQRSIGGCLNFVKINVCSVEKIEKYSFPYLNFFPNFLWFEFVLECPPSYDTLCGDVWSCNTVYRCWCTTATSTPPWRRWKSWGTLFFMESATTRSL